MVIGGVAHVLRPSFSALVAAEEELGPLFALVDRSAAGELKIGEMTALFWHCLVQRDVVSREAVGQAIVTIGLAAAAKPLRSLIAQILQGEG